MGFFIQSLVNILLGPYLRNKANKLSNTEEYQKVQQKIKKLEAEMEVLHQKDEEWDKLAKKGTTAYEKSMEISMKLTDDRINKVLQSLKPKNKKSNK
ncbi:MAG: hypothetical protein ACOYLP_07790 [Flavobacterium sp.]|uniref:hypothetical protein n=1 Tax=Flavobacterium sp. TaxID=239 RepID=UPI003BE22472